MRTRRDFATAFVLVVALLGCGLGSNVAPAGAPRAESSGRPRPESRESAQVQAPAPATPPVALPNKDGSLKFGVLGDFGTGDRLQYELAEQMAKLYERFKMKLVITVGDNIYGADRPQDFRNKFEMPYKLLLDAGVKFYASLGNHDSREQRYYKLFNMNGKLYYSFKAPDEDVRFFALESSYPQPDQIKWLEKELDGSNEDWKIVYFHHPLYSSGDRHGSDVELRKILEPIFLKHNVSVVFNGHDHFYERIKPQNGIAYFVVGSGGKLRRGNIDRRSGLTAKGFDADLAFLAAEISGDQLYFNAITRTGDIIDSGIITRQKPQS
jgi:predicted phosphodiesterase